MNKNEFEQTKNRFKSLMETKGKLETIFHQARPSEKLSLRKSCREIDKKIREIFDHSTESELDIMMGIV